MSLPTEIRLAKDELIRDTGLFGWNCGFLMSKDVEDR